MSKKEQRIYAGWVGAHLFSFGTALSKRSKHSLDNYMQRNTAMFPKSSKCDYCRRSQSIKTKKWYKKRVKEYKKLDLIN